MLFDSVSDENEDETISDTKDADPEDETATTDENGDDESSTTTNHDSSPLSRWSEWTPCDKGGDGRRMRSRKCLSKNFEVDCADRLLQTQWCKNGKGKYTLLGFYVFVHSYVSRSI